MLRRIARKMRANRADGVNERRPLKRWAVRPEGWKSAQGYENGVVVERGGRMLFVAGQIAWDAEQKLVGAGDMGAQFIQALENVLTIVAEAGGRPEEVVRMTVYVTDKEAYLAATRDIGAAWRKLLGKYYPAMALVQVADLLESGALVEIEATAVIG